MTTVKSPLGWYKTTLGTVLELKYGKSLSTKSRDGGNYPVYGSNGIVGQHSLPLVQTPGLIIGRKGSHGVVNASFGPFFPIDTTYFIDNFGGQPIRFWYYFLKFLPLTELNRSTAIPGLNREDAYRLEIHVPSLAEQKIITQKLDTMLAQVESTKARLERTRETLKRFRQSVLAAAVSGKLTAEWREHRFLNADLDLNNEISYNSDKERKTEATSSHEIVLETFPSCWAKTTFSKIYRFIDYRGKTPSKSESGKRLYTAKNIKMGFISDSPIEYLSEEYFKLWMTRGFTKKGDILFVTEGHTMGCVALNEIGSDIGLAQRTLTIQPYGKVRTKFHLYYMMDVNFQKLIDLNATGSAAKGIKAAKFRGLPVPFPSYEEQTEIVRRVEQLFAHADTIEKQTEAALAKVNNLTQSILAKAFRGELTAQWRAENPELISGENSAEALLKRIQAERAAQAPKTRKSKAAKATAGT